MNGADDSGTDDTEARTGVTTGRGTTPFVAEADGPPKTTDPRATVSDRTETRTLLVLSVAGGVLFALGLIITESVGETATDVDLKPFFVPYLLIAAVRFGVPTLSVGVGAAAGEGLLDIVEGYEIDDPIGFLGYVVGFLAFGWYLHEVADDPTSRRTQTVAALLGAAVQAVFEAAAFLIFELSAMPGEAVVSLVGNTVTHGLVLGAVPLVVLSPLVGERVATVFE